MEKLIAKVITWRDLCEIDHVAYEIVRNPETRKKLANLNKSTDKSNFKENEKLEGEICSFSRGRLIHVSAEDSGTKNNLVGGDCYLEYKCGDHVRMVKVDIKNSDTPGCCGSISRNSIEQEFDTAYLAFEQNYEKYFISSRLSFQSCLGELIHYYKDQCVIYNEYKKMLEHSNILCLERSAIEYNYL